MDTNSATERYDRLANTAQSFIKSYDLAFDTRDFTHLSSNSTKSCIRHYAPDKIFELLPDFVQGRTNVQYEQQETAVWSNFTAINSSIVEIAVDERQNKVWIIGRHRCVKKDGTVLSVENAYTLWMEDQKGDEGSSGMVITRILQYTDTLSAKELLDLQQGSLEAFGEVRN